MRGRPKTVFVKNQKTVRLVLKGEKGEKGAKEDVEVPPPPVPEPESLFEFFCPYCGHKIPTRRSKSGKQITCSVCDQSVAVPNPSLSEISVSEPREEVAPEPCFKFFCVYCGQRLSTTLNDCGKHTTCPCCGTSFNIPGEPPDPERFQPNANEPVAFVYFCQYCGRRHSAIESWVGETFQCSGCEHVLTIPPPLEES